MTPIDPTQDGRPEPAPDDVPRPAPKRRRIQDEFPPFDPATAPPMGGRRPGEHGGDHKPGRLPLR